MHTFNLELAENAFFASERLMLLLKDWFFIYLVLLVLQKQCHDVSLCAVSSHKIV